MDRSTDLSEERPFRYADHSAGERAHEPPDAPGAGGGLGSRGANLNSADAAALAAGLRGLFGRTLHEAT